MKKYFLYIACATITLLSFLTLPLVKASIYESPVNLEEEHLQLNHEDFQRLEKQGYTVHEIIKAAHISMYANKSIESILRYYKKHQSWHETANHFGVDLEKLKTDQMRKTKQLLYKENKEKIIYILANYTNRKPEEISRYLKQDADLHFLIVAAAISKTTETDLSKIIQLKKEEKSLDEIMNTVHANRKMVFKEVKLLHEKIKHLK